MSEFVLVGHDVPTDADFSLDALPGEAGRLDLLARSVVAALLTSHGVREDVQVSIVISDEYAIRIDGASVRNLHPDERSAAAQIRSALEERDGVVGDVEVEASPGVFLSRRGFARTVRDAAERGTVLQLHEDGESATDVTVPEAPVFVLSDHQDFRDAEAAVLEEVADGRISLGPRAIHADQAVAVAHNWVDTDGFASY